MKIAPLAEVKAHLSSPYAEIYGVAEGCGAANQERARTQARRLLAGSEESKIAWQFRGRSESRPPSSVPRLITCYIL